MAHISQKEYLKRYLSGDKPKKKKSKVKPSVKATNVKIIDDDIEVIQTEEAVVKVEALAELGEEAPQVVGFVDERPLALRVDDYRKSDKWKPLGGFNEVVSEGTVPHNRNKLVIGIVKSENSTVKPKTNDKSSARRSNKEDYSPKRRNYDSDLSPPRRNQSSGDDLSPPRRSTNNDSDHSPQRRPKHTKNDAAPLNIKSEKPDVSSAKRTKNYDSDASPPRRKHPDSDVSPPRKKKHYDSDASPPRRTKHYDSDSSPPRKRSQKRDNDQNRSKRTNEGQDASQSIKKERNPCDSDESPPRRSNSSPSRMRAGRRDEGTSHRKASRWGNSSVKQEDSFSDKREDHLDSKRNKDSNRASKTLDGRTAGLQHAGALHQEQAELRRRDDEAFQQLGAEVLGRDAVTVVRDRRTGTVRDLAAEADRERAKAAEEAKRKEKYDRWGGGVKQAEDKERRIEEALHEMNKPLARYADDEDLEKYLREQERDGDPMAAYFRKKRMQKAIAEGKTIKPTFQGEFMPNRFAIPPGHRWDGVDRSNGYEKSWFEAQNARKARTEVVYKWSTEDM